MTYISVDIDIDDIPVDEILSSCQFDDLVYELEQRLTKGRANAAILKSRASKVLEALEQPLAYLQINTLDDQVKIEHLAKVWEKYSAADLENLLPE